MGKKESKWNEKKGERNLFLSLHTYSTSYERYAAELKPLFHKEGCRSAGEAGWRAECQD
jgi:hypothetical protein